MSLKEEERKTEVIKTYFAPAKDFIETVEKLIKM